MCRPKKYTSDARLVFRVHYERCSVIGVNEVLLNAGKYFARMKEKVREEDDVVILWRVIVAVERGMAVMEERPMKDVVSIERLISFYIRQNKCLDISPKSSSLL